MLGRHAGRCYLELQANCLTFVIVTITIMAYPGHTFSHCVVTTSHSHLADGCRHVYVDMGTNIGHQEVTQGVLCDVSMVYGEHLTPDWIASATSILKLANCSTEIFYLDDEGGDDSLALPVEVHLETAV